MNREQFRRQLVEDLGDGFAYSYFDPSEFTEGSTPVLRPWSYVADERIRDRAWPTLQREGVRLGPVVAAHLKPKDRR